MNFSSSQKMRKNITIRIHHNGNEGTFKVVWCDANGISFPPYSIPSAPLLDTAVKIRKGLAEMVLLIRREGAINSGGKLTQIAESGAHLFKALFLGDTGADKALCGSISQWLANNFEPQFTALTFVVGSSVQIPWGLIYDEELPVSKPDLLNPNWEYAHFPGFWCVKYSLSCLYDRITPLGLKAAFSPSNFRVLAALNEQLWSNTISMMGENEGAAADAFVRRSIAPVTDKQMLFNAWNKNKDSIGILFFYCHSDGRNLDLGNENVLTHSDIQLQLTRDDASHHSAPTFLILAGCNTAVGNETGGFLGATAASGFCGFVGTEAIVPDVFSFRFSLALLTDLYRGGKALGDVVSDLRIRHWPLSLLFTISCPSNIAVSSCGDGEIAPSTNENFSLMNISSLGIA
jgi:hypothetical protein